MLDSGRWEGKQIIPALWVRACTSPARADITDYGLLWWLYPDLKESATDSGGFGGDGWLGQYLVVYPKQHLVAVRLHAVDSSNDERENRKHGFTSFRKMVFDLVRSSAVPSNDKFKIEVH